MTEAHPRSRGEHREAAKKLSPSEGSSPLTRGARDVENPTAPVRGLIPAHAGSTRAPSRPSLPHWAHPRSRGEHANEETSLPLFEGSSPLTRGAQTQPLTAHAAGGLIPAHAGST